MWKTDFTLMNRSDKSALYTTLILGFPRPGYDSFPPGHVQPMNDPNTSPRGRLLWIEEPQIEDFVFSLRVRDLVRQAGSAGVDIPVVRESEFRPRITLLNVPTDERFRHSLRIYEPSFEGIDVRVRAFTDDADDPIAEFIVPLIPGDRALPIWGEPSEGQRHDLLASYPELRAIPTIHFSIEPLTPGRRIWAFITVTSNETQELTTVTPQ